MSHELSTYQQQLQEKLDGKQYIDLRRTMLSDVVIDARAVPAESQRKALQAAVTRMLNISDPMLYLSDSSAQENMETNKIIDSICLKIRMAAKLMLATNTESFNSVVQEMNDNSARLRLDFHETLIDLSGGSAADSKRTLQVGQQTSVTSVLELVRTISQSFAHLAAPPATAWNTGGFDAWGDIIGMRSKAAGSSCSTGSYAAASQDDLGDVPVLR